MNKNFFINNRNKVGEKLEEKSRLVLFSGTAPQRSADQGYPYTANRNFYYLTGLEREKFILLISKRNGEVKETLFIEEGNPDLEKWIGKRMRAEEAKEISGIENIKFISEFYDFFNDTLLRNEYEYVYLDIERRGWDISSTPAIDFAEKVSKKYHYLRVKNAYNMLSQLRLIKSNEEVEKIAEAISITNKGIQNLMLNAKSGMKEYQLEAHFDFTIKTMGAKKHAFKTIAASGENATVLHYEENNTEIKDGDLILFDLGAEYENYCADISRTFPINGTFTDRQKKFTCFLS